LEVNLRRFRRRGENSRGWRNVSILELRSNFFGFHSRKNSIRNLENFPRKQENFTKIATQLLMSHKLCPKLSKPFCPSRGEFFHDSVTEDDKDDKGHEI
jgi:hypothetical protein